MYYALDPKIGA